MLKHHRLIALGLLILALVALCARPADAGRETFQDQLNAVGIDYEVPPMGKAILVNIPAFELIAFQDGTPVFRSRAIVGAPRHRTPRLQTYVSSVRFRPTWRPTPSMIASGEYDDRIRPAGETNPLGLAAVRLEPGLLVYLHDTNRRELFATSDRAMSHGCIRVEDWSKLIAFVLGVDQSTVLQHAYGTRTFDAAAPEIPVELAYFLNFPNTEGKIVRHPDIYDLRPETTSTTSDTISKAVSCAIDALKD